MAAHAHSTQGLPEDEGAFCTSCGMVRAHGAQFCGSCGAPTAADASVAPTQVMPVVPAPVVADAAPRHLHVVAQPAAAVPGTAKAASRMPLLLVGGIAGVLALACVLAAVFLVMRGDSAAATEAAEKAAIEQAQDLVKPVTDAHVALASELQGISGKVAPVTQAKARQLADATNAAEGALDAEKKSSDELEPEAREAHRDAMRDARDLLSASSAYAANVESVVKSPGSAAAVGTVGSDAEKVRAAIAKLDMNSSLETQVADGARKLVEWAPKAQKARANARKARADAQKARVDKAASDAAAAAAASAAPRYGYGGYGYGYGYGYARSYSYGTGCGSLSTSSSTSMPFAQNVCQAAYSRAQSGGFFTVNAYSPVTHVNYTMSCSASGGSATCTGGNNARVTFSY